MSSRKPPSGPSDWDDFEIPTWDDSFPSTPRRSSPSPAARPSSSSKQAYPDPLYDDYAAPTYPSRSNVEPQPPTRLSSRVPARSTRPAQDPYRDPYSGIDDSFAGAAYYPETQQPTRAASSSQYDLYAEPAMDTGWDDAPVYDEAPTRRRGRSSRQSTRTERRSVSVSRPAISDSWVATIVGIAALGLLALAGLVWWGLGDIGDVIPWHLNASGDVDHWVSSSTLWRIPFGVFMSMMMGILMGLYLWKRDRFAARFIITSLCLVQVLAWVAVIDQLW